MGETRSTGAWASLAVFRSLIQARSQRTALAIASGKFRTVTEEQFDLQNRIQAERAFAILSLQGHELEKIVAIRGRATGTFHAQLAGIHGKSGVSNGAQPSAAFVGQPIAGEDQRPASEGI